MNEKTRSLYRKFALIGGIISFLMLVMVGLYFSVTIRMTLEQRLYSLITAGIVCSGLVIIYIFWVLKDMKTQIGELEPADEEGKITKIEKALSLPARFSLTAFWFWAIGSLMCSIIFYIFFGFSGVQSIEVFFLGMCGGFFAPLLMYYLYKEALRKFLKNLNVKIDHKAYQKFLSLSLPVKVTIPFVISILITFILIITISMRMRDDLISGVLKSIGEKELALLKTGEHQPVGGKITIDPNDIKGKIEGIIAESSKRGKKIYIDPSTMNIFVFESGGDGKIESIVYPWKEIVRYPSPWHRSIWTLALFSLAILVLIPYLIMRDLKTSIEEAKNFLQKKEKPAPSDDEFNSLFFALLKFADDFENMANEMIYRVETAERNFSKVLETMKLIENDLLFFEDALGGIRRHTEEEKNHIATLGSFLNESKDFFKVGDEGMQMEVMLKNNKEVSEEIINALHSAVDEGKKIFSSLKEVEKLKAAELLKKIDLMKENFQRLKRIEEMKGAYGKAGESLSEIKNTLFTLEEKIKESKEKVKNFSDEIKGVSASIENVKKDSEKIGEIARVIKEIIEETNLLSLNASIIAAQAGEKGRSFAVVAEEIKELAERTEMSTGEINQILGELHRFVENLGDRIGEINDFAGIFTKNCDLIEEKFQFAISGMEKVDSSFKEFVKLSSEISSLYSDFEENVSVFERIFSPAVSYEKYLEYVKDTVSVLEKAMEFVVRSQNFLEDQISFVKTMKERGGTYLQKLEGIKKSFDAIEHEISEVVNSLEKIVKLINNMKIKIKEVGQ
jgi:methyl-accepting chemotaxis protein